MSFLRIVSSEITIFELYFEAKWQSSLAQQKQNYRLVDVIFRELLSLFPGYFSSDNESRND